MLSREELTGELIEHDPTLDTSKVGLNFASISSQMGMKKNDFLRQIVAYEYPTTRGRRITSGWWPGRGERSPDWLLHTAAWRYQTFLLRFSPAIEGHLRNAPK